MKNFKGVFTALITPFKNGKIDFNSVARLVRQQIEGGIDGFVINGTTAESPTLNEKDVEELFHFIKKQCAGEKILILGTGSNSTEKTIENSKNAQALGADAVLVVVPYYNKPPQRGLFEHFKKTAESINIPVILYNVPGRTITSLAPETVIRLSQIKNIIGIKEASGDIGVLKKILAGVPKDFVLLSGDDGTYVDFLAEGGHGVISVTSHLFPLAMKSWLNQVAEKEVGQAKKEFEKYKKLTDMCFVEANPIPVKAALAMMKIIDADEMRLPLMPLEDQWRSPLQQELKNLKLL